MTEQKIELKMIRMSEVQSQEIEWLWYPFIPYGKREGGRTVGSGRVATVIE